MHRKLFDEAVSILGGRFGKRTLKMPYRRVWQLLSWGSLISLTIYVLHIVHVWWMGIVELLNYIIWGK